MFMQDGAGPRRATSVVGCLEAYFPNVWAAGVWPPSSPDFSCLDCFGRGYVQHKIGLGRAENVDIPKLAIRAAAENIPSGLAERAEANFC